MQVVSMVLAVTKQACVNTTMLNDNQQCVSHVDWLAFLLYSCKVAF